MRIGIISGVIGLFVTLSVHAQKSDSIKSMLLPDVVVTESYQQRQAKKSALIRGSIQNVAWTKCRTKYVKPLVHR